MKQRNEEMITQGVIPMAKRKWTAEEVAAYQKEHSRYFYFNKDDRNISVRKPFGIGWTLNMANPLSWAVLGGILLAAVAVKYF